jgi:hypothetical protein
MGEGDCYKADRRESSAISRPGLSFSCGHKALSYGQKTHAASRTPYCQNSPSRSQHGRARYVRVLADSQQEEHIALATAHAGSHAGPHRPPVSPLLIPLVYCYINGFQRASRVEKPLLGGEKRRGERAAPPVALWGDWGVSSPVDVTEVSLIARGCLSGATPRGQPWTSAVLLPQERNGRNARRMAVW